MKATWNGATIAESDQTIEVEGNHYFPPNSVRMRYLRPGDKHTQCPWKGKASYYDIVVGADVNKAAAWYYPDPEAAAMAIKNYVAFWQGVEVRA